MDYYCEACDKHIKSKRKYKQPKSKIPKEFDECDHIVVSLKDIDINKLDEAFYLYINKHIKITDYYLVKCQFKLVFNDYQNCPYITSKFTNKRTMISRKEFLEKVIVDFENKGYNFNHLAAMKNITTANNFDMSYDFYIK